MPLHRKIDEKLGLVLAIAVGEVQHHEVLEAILSLPDTAGAEKTYRRLIDLRQGTIGQSDGEMNDILSRLQEQFGLVSAQRIAVVKDSDSDLPGIAALSGALAPLDVEVKTFDSMAEALGWFAGR